MKELIDPQQRFYNVWRNMIQRCNNPKNPLYKWYGGRGITICEKWLTYLGFEEDMYVSYTDHAYEYGHGVGVTTIDRIDNDKGYYKENCRWTDLKEQGRNKRQPQKRHLTKVI